MRHQPAAVVEVLRGNLVESAHLVDMVVCDADGAVMESWGEASTAIFPRSAIKALQALPLIESGAADAFGFEDTQLALACSSHNGEPAHVEMARKGLASAGLTETCLECGAQHPKHPEDIEALARQGLSIGPIHNNCSGKHVGFLAFGQHQGFETKGYINVDHPVQREIAQVLTEVTAHPHSADLYGIDGCSIPTYPVPLENLATAFAKFGIGRDPSALRSKAMLRLRDACMAHPEMVAGKGRVCTELMQALPGQVFAKVGAEGVYTAAFPALGLGAAMKARDGNFRAVEVAVGDLARRLLGLVEGENAALDALVCPNLKNWNGRTVGRVRISHPE